MTNEQREILINLDKSPFGKVLREFLNEEKEKIGDLRQVTSWEETQGRKFALELIDKLFSFMSEEKKEVKSKSQYY